MPLRIGTVTSGSKLCLPQNSSEFAIAQSHSPFSLQILKLYTDLHLTLLYILISRIYCKFVRENKSPTLGVCFLQLFSSAGRMMYTCLPRTDHLWITTDCLVHFHKNKLDKMLRKLDSTEYPYRFEEYPTLPE